MTRKMVVKQLLLLTAATCCFVWLGSAAFADDVDDWMIESSLDRYYHLPRTARVVGMGGASWVTSTDISSVFGNPAGLGFINRPMVGLTYSNDEFSGTDASFEPFPGRGKAAGDPVFHDANSDTNGGGLQLALPCYSQGVFGFGGWWDGSDYNDYERTDSDRFRFNAGYGYNFNECFSIGYNMTYFNQDIEDRYSDYNLDNGFRHTFGLLLRPSPTCSFGASTYFAHGSPSTDFDYYGDDYGGDLDAWGFDVGYSWQVLQCTLLAASVDYEENTYDGDIYAPDMDEIRSIDEEIKGWGFHVGLEQNYRDCLFGRVGYRYQMNDYENFQRGEYFHDGQDFESNYHAVASGLGWRIRPCITLDYGMEYRFLGDGDLNNTVTVQYNF